MEGNGDLMEVKKYFTIEESMQQENYYIIKINDLSMLPIKTENMTGSYNVLPARLMNLSYAQYLRMCRDLFGAEIVGKNSYYPVALFRKGKILDQFVKLLNSRMELVLNEIKLRTLEGFYDE